MSNILRRAGRPPRSRKFTLIALIVQICVCGIQAYHDRTSVILPQFPHMCVWFSSIEQLLLLQTAPPPPLLHHALNDQVNSSSSPPCMRQRVYTFSYIAAVCKLLASALPLRRTLQTVCCFFLVFFIVSLQSAVQQKAGGCSGLAMLHARSSQEGATTVSCRDPHLHSTPQHIIYSLASLASFHLITLILK